MPPSRSAAAPARHDLYTRIHKALRLFMSDTLARIGRADGEAPAELRAAMAQLRSLLALLRQHTQHEHDVVRPVLEARLPGATMRSEADHAAHLEAIDALHDAADELDASTPAERAAMLAGLYRELALLAALHFQHMHDEETTLAPALWTVCDDAELRALEQRILSRQLPQEQAESLRWIAASASVPELLGMLATVRRIAPPAAFAGLLGQVCELMDEPRRERLVRALSDEGDDSGAQSSTMS